MRYTLMHISDLHAGPPFRLDLAEQITREAQALKPDLLVISGDFVQRADFAAQWRTITAFIRTLPQPILTVPGNHDVPLLNPFNRIFDPNREYQQYISGELNQVFTKPGLVVVGGNTAHGRTIDGGYLSPDQMQKMESVFSQYDETVCKVAVLHHHVVSPPGDAGRHRRRKISNAEEVARFLDRCGVELLLCGHIHVSYVGNTLDVMPDLREGTIICQSGTTTSRRGRLREQGKNSYNIIEIDDQVIRISQHLYMEDQHSFVPVAEHVFPQRSTGAYQLPRHDRIIKADS